MPKNNWADHSLFVVVQGIAGNPLALAIGEHNRGNCALRLASGVAAIALMFPPLLTAYGVDGYFLNAAAAAGLIALCAVRMRTDVRMA